MNTLSAQLLIPCNYSNLIKSIEIISTNKSNQILNENNSIKCMTIDGLPSRNEQSQRTFMKYSIETDNDEMMKMKVDRHYSLTIAIDTYSINESSIVHNGTDDYFVNQSFVQRNHDVQAYVRFSFITGTKHYLKTRYLSILNKMNFVLFKNRKFLKIIFIKNYSI